MYIVTLITLERRAVFVTLTAGVQKLHPLYLRIGLEIFEAVCTKSVGNHKHIISNVLETKNFQATPTKIKMAAIRPDVNLMS